MSIFYVSLSAGERETTPEHWILLPGYVRSQVKDQNQISTNNCSLAFVYRIFLGEKNDFYSHEQCAVGE